MFRISVPHVYQSDLINFVRLLFSSRMVGTRSSRRRDGFKGADGVSDRVIELSVQIMLEELGPNLWEHKLER